MGRTPCCDKANVKKGPWSPEEDAKLKDYIHKHGTGGNWISLPQKAGLKRCGKSCRLRWLNYLRPDIKHGDFSEEEDRIICHLYSTIGSRWSIIATQLAGRTDNDIKNYWNTKLKKKLMGLKNNIPTSQKTNSSSSSSSLSSYSNHNNNNLMINSLFSSQNRPFSTLLDPISFSPNNHLNFSTPLISTTNNNNYNNNATPFHQFSQDQSFIINNQMGGGANQNNYHVVDDQDSLLVFGGDQPTCSSSDGSVKGDDNEYGKVGVGVGIEEKRRMSFVECSSGNNIGWNEKQLNDDGMIWNNMESTTTNTTLMDYGLEEIKQLMSSSSSCNNNVFWMKLHIERES